MRLALLVALVLASALASACVIPTADGKGWQDCIVDQVDPYTHVTCTQLP